MRWQQWYQIGKKDRTPQNLTKMMGPQVLASPFPLSSSIKQKQSIKYQRNHSLQKTCRNGKQTNYKNLAIRRTSKPKLRHGLANTALFVLVLESTTNPWLQLFHKPWKKLSRWTKTSYVETVVFMWRLLLYAINNMLVKP